MRIAFDVKGTIEGPKKELVLKLFKGLQAKGHICIVWSNYYGFAVDAIKNNNLTNTQAMSKASSYDLEDQRQPLFDLAVEDDRMQGSYLGAKEFLFVDDITSEKVEGLIK